MNSVELLDKEIEKSLERARSLRELRNSQYSSTSRLPLEVLTLIFEALAFTKDPKPSAHEGHSRSTKVTGNFHPCHNISHVCRSWRTLVLSMPAIWGIFYGECSKKWMDSITASRVKPNAPIFLRAPRFTTPRSRYWRQTHVLGFEAARYEELEVEVANPDVALALYDLFRWRRTLPALTMLDISWTPSGGDANVLRWNADAPRLEVMNLRDVSLRLMGGSFPILHSFTMVLDSSPLITIVELLQLLKAMPRLRSLECVRMPSDIGFQPIPADLQVELPYLEHVDIRQLCWEGLCIFDHITSPPLKSFTLMMSNWRYKTDTMPNMTSVYKFLPPPPSPAEPWKTLVQKSGDSFYDDIDFTLKMEIVPGSPSTTPDFRFEFLSNFTCMKKEMHVELDVCSLLPSIPNIVAVIFRPLIDGGVLHRPAYLLPKSFVVGMAPLEEAHFNDLALLLEALMPGCPLDTEVSTESAFPRALPEPDEPDATAACESPVPPPGLPAPQVYLPNLRRAVLVQRPVEVAEEWRAILLPRLRRILKARRDMGLPILTLKIGGNIELSDDEKAALGDGALLQVLSKDECAQYEATSLKTPSHTRP
ncbi:hypothetical protein AB1N83_007748 [Pleurotus pulmonarius]